MRTVNRSPSWRCAIGRKRPIQLEHSEQVVSTHSRRSLS
jgi:hypothetical protein